MHFKIERDTSFSSGKFQNYIVRYRSWLRLLQNPQYIQIHFWMTCAENWGINNFYFKKKEENKTLLQKWLC